MSIQPKKKDNGMNSGGWGLEATGKGDGIGQNFKKWG